MTSNTKKLLIIGSGPAGYTAAIYAGRAGLNPLLYQGEDPGGQLTSTTDVENYPGFPKGILGPELMMNFSKQAEKFETIIRSDWVISVEGENSPYKVSFKKDHSVYAKSIIIATGASSKWLQLPSEQRLVGRGVSSCAVCDGFFFKDNDVAVVGGGDSAAEEVLHLAKFCKKIYLLVRKGKMRASHILQQRIKNCSKIEILWHTEVEEVLGEDAVVGIISKNNKTKRTSTINLKALFIAIGHTPNTVPFRDFLELDSMGYIPTIAGTTKTSKEGVFAAGDVQDKLYRQAVTAAGSGCMAAIDAERFLTRNT